MLSEDEFRANLGPTLSRELDTVLFEEKCDGGALLVQTHFGTTMLVPYGTDWHYRILAEAWREYGGEIISHWRIRHDPVATDGMVELDDLETLRNACASLGALHVIDDVLSRGLPDGIVLLAKLDDYADQQVLVYGSKYIAKTLHTITSAYPWPSSGKPLSPDGFVPVAHVKLAKAQPTDEELQERFGLATTSSVLQVEALIVATCACPKCGAPAGWCCWSKKSSTVPIHNRRADAGREPSNRSSWWPKYQEWQARMIAYNAARDKRDGRD